jgi:hypothetical protein
MGIVGRRGCELGLHQDLRLGLDLRCRCQSRSACQSRGVSASNFRRGRLALVFERKREMHSLAQRPSVIQSMPLFPGISIRTF